MKVGLHLARLKQPELRKIWISLGEHEEEVNKSKREKL